MYVEFASDIRDDNDGTFLCCETREAVDAKLDGLELELKSVYPKTYERFRNVQCHLGCTNEQRESNIDVDKVLSRLVKQSW